MIDDAELKARATIINDFKLYSSACLKIATKSGGMLPLKLNKAQMHIHNSAQEQLKKSGRVRIIVLKGRQQGVSTYVEARFFWRVTNSIGTRAYIMAHEADATSNLFAIADRYYNNCPDIFRPERTANNAREMIFGHLDSGYKVATAGNADAGRSSTIHFFHASEVSRWSHASEIASGALQAVPDSVGTEIFIESTSAGIGNWFHTLWQDAERGANDFLPVFCPWFWQTEYRKQVPTNYEFSKDDREYAHLYKLDEEQLFWRITKISQLSDGIIDGALRFKQEYPATPIEAFEANQDGSTLIPHDWAQLARKTDIYQNESDITPLIIGVDPAAGRDKCRSAIIRRRGNKAYGLDTFNNRDLMELVGILFRIYQDEKPSKIIIDIGGVGYGVGDRLAELIPKHILERINFGSKTLYKNRYYNKRAEMWGEMASWLQAGNCQIPDDDTLHKELCSVRIKRINSEGAILLEEKEEVIKKLGFSPDAADALALTFAVPTISIKPLINREQDQLLAIFGKNNTIQNSQPASFFGI